MKVAAPDLGRLHDTDPLHPDGGEEGVGPGGPGLSRRGETLSCVDVRGSGFHQLPHPMHDFLGPTLESEDTSLCPRAPTEPFEDSRVTKGGERVCQL